MNLTSLLPFRRGCGSACAPRSARQPASSALAYRPPFSAFDDEFDRLFSLVAGGAGVPWWSGANAWRSPAVNLSEGEREYVIEAEVPGLSEQEISVEVERNVLHLRGEHREDSGKDAERQVRSLRFARSFTLPEDVNAEAIHASLRHGVLTVTVPKAESAAPRGKSIPVTAG